MTRKLTLLTIVVLISLFITSPVLAAKTYYAERFDVLIELQEDGSAIITETVEFRFSGDPYTFAFREVSARNTDGVTFLEASIDGVTMPQGTEAGQVEVEAGSPLKVRWHFAPTSETTHIFTLRYAVQGIIRKGDADTFIWRAIPEEHEYIIGHSTITLTYPPEATLLETPTLDVGFDTALQADRIILTSSGLTADEDVIVTARFASNSFTSSTPQWQADAQQADAANARGLPIAAIAGILAVVMGSLGLFTYARTNARELTVIPVTANPTPPADVPPAVVGKLGGHAHGFMGTIFDLAQRGVLEVTEEKGAWGTTNHLLTRKETNASLHTHEQGLLDAIFTAGESQVNMSEVATRLASNPAPFDEPLTQELIQRGWLDPERKALRSRLIATGFIMMLVALVLFVISIISFNMFVSNLNLITVIGIFAGISAGLFLLSLGLLIYASTFSTLTPLGEEQVARWKGFAEYLKDVSKGKEPAISPDYFERYLAYAAVFGLGTKWAEYFQTFNGMPLPIWFHATSGSQANFGSMVAVMSSSDSAGASAGGGGAGGGGASGGGSSGAG